MDVGAEKHSCTIVSKLVVYVKNGQRKIKVMLFYAEAVDFRLQSQALPLPLPLPVCSHLESVNT